MMTAEEKKRTYRVPWGDDSWEVEAISEQDAIDEIAAGLVQRSDVNVDGLSACAVGEMCAYCDEFIVDDRVPDEDDDDAWAELAQEHIKGCEWIETRAHHRVYVE
jgi:hypothetical protein